MTNKKILEKAIAKAIDGGWMTTLASSFMEWSVGGDDGDTWVNRELAGVPMYKLFASQIIFDKQFAKALWGEGSKAHKLNERVTVYDFPWQTHLQNMVIADDPIQYLGENI